jgi:asparagine synthase (glutamine-hydrolysing)
MAKDTVLVHERLAIVGVGECQRYDIVRNQADKTDTGAQPLVNDDETIILAVNGEIYNHVELRKSLKNPATFKTHSDCEVIMHLVSATTTAAEYAH